MENGWATVRHRSLTAAALIIDGSKTSFRVYTACPMRGIRALALASVCAGLAAHAQIRFNRDIRPIMAETCFRCHGPDKNARMAGMRLDIREEALKPLPDGNVPIVPGDAEKSAIIQRIFAPGARVMPPPYSHKELTAAQKNTIRQSAGGAAGGAQARQSD
jgi:hypothetical protein